MPVSIRYKAVQLALLGGRQIILPAITHPGVSKETYPQICIKVFLLAKEGSKGESHQYVNTIKCVMQTKMAVMSLGDVVCETTAVFSLAEMSLCGTTVCIFHLSSHKSVVTN